MINPTGLTIDFVGPFFLVLNLNVMSADTYGKGTGCQHIEMSADTYGNLPKMPKGQSPI